MLNYTLPPTSDAQEQGVKLSPIWPIQWPVLDTSQVKEIMGSLRNQMSIWEGRTLSSSRKSGHHLLHTYLVPSTLPGTPGKQQETK